MKGYVYILYSPGCRKSYVGSTPDPRRRVQEHNLGKNKSTYYCRPWKMIFCEEFNSLEQARRQEKYYKSYAGRIKFKEIFKNIGE